MESHSTHLGVICSRGSADQHTLTQCEREQHDEVGRVAAPARAQHMSVHILPCKSQHRRIYCIGPTCSSVRLFMYWEQSTSCNSRSSFRLTSNVPHPAIHQPACTLLHDHRDDHPSTSRARQTPPPKPHEPCAVPPSTSTHAQMPAGAALSSAPHPRQTHRADSEHDIVSTRAKEPTMEVMRTHGLADTYSFTGSLRSSQHGSVNNRM